MAVASHASGGGTSHRGVLLLLLLPGLIALLTTFLLPLVWLVRASFVTPRLMGGGRVFVIGTEVYNEATVTLNWPLAAALSVLLLVLFGSVIVIYQRAMRALET